jgi:hypothetical protein
MRHLGRQPIMLLMTRPTAASKLVLIADSRGGDAEPATATVRRYRLARLRFDGRPADPDARFEHLKRAFD